jgi:hypothetical protein
MARLYVQLLVEQLTSTRVHGVQLLTFFMYVATTGARLIKAGRSISWEPLVRWRRTESDWSCKLHPSS